ncbi:MAG: hypothetical protein EKK55_19255 [Rhodocyclaceae bacterium]|nr:MAG: hypothetical protein EKK55_19255 [Rhodocyclaceae bacterium]
MTTFRVTAHTAEARERALRCAETFAADYPERMGIRQCVVYSYRALGESFVCYRTRGGEVVSRQDIPLYKSDAGPVILEP